MTVLQKFITIAVVVLATVITRFTPYIAFPEGKPVPDFVKYLGKYLAPAVFGLLVVYCLRNVSWIHGSHGLPELAALGATLLVFMKTRSMMAPMLAGTAVYMLIVNLI